MQAIQNPAYRRTGNTMRGVRRNPPDAPPVCKTSPNALEDFAPHGLARVVWRGMRVRCEKMQPKFSCAARGNFCLRLRMSRKTRSRFVLSERMANLVSAWNILFRFETDRVKRMRQRRINVLKRPGYSPGRFASRLVAITLPDETGRIESVLR